jgi:hypothetical protein
MNDLKRMRALKLLTQTQLAGVQSQFASLSTKENRLRNNLAQLVKEKRQTAERSDHGDVARAAGADIRWHKWVDARRAIINTELAQVLGQKLECQQKLRRAFGKDQALDAIIQQQNKLVIARQNRRQP